jgi:TonB family protein
MIDPVDDADPLFDDVAEPAGPGGPGGPDTDSDGWEPGSDWVFEVQPEALPRQDDFIAVEKEPRLIQMDTPLYPELAREAGVEGQVLVRVLVGRDGLVRDAVVIRSVPMLDAAALAAARTAVFKPALQHDTTVAVWIVIPIEFALRH